MKRVRWLYAAAFVAATLLVAAPALAQGEGANAGTNTSATYVGSKACAKCHEEQVEAFTKNPHYGAAIDANPNGEPTVGCESCHGPGSLHVAADGDDSDPRFKTIWNLKGMKAPDVNKVCGTCHRTGEQFYWAQSAHAHNDVSCRDCHSIHDSKDPGGEKLLQATSATDLCVKCHHDKRAELVHTAHMPVREGSMTCADCHNPHGSPGPHMIRGASNNELCTTCHMDKRGPFLWEHPPVRENCVTCHMPHGSNNDKVLASKKPFLCQRCHIATRHPSTLYDGAPSDLASNRLFNRSCTNCHSQIHGSNHPSGKTFLR
ncbi:MAG TPA: DmsE family decaheme c-type cytochrome [Candidatus Eisenbacteria bacterium]